MSTKYKKMNKKEKEVNDEEKENTISKKELYDLKQKAKKEEREKKISHKKKKKKNKTYSTNLGAKIFAIIMLILMLGSIVSAISYAFR